MTVGKDEHDKGAVLGQVDKLDMLDRGFVFRSEDEGGTMRHARERRADPVEHGGHIGRVRAERFLDLLAVFGLDIADFQKAIDEHAQADLRGNAPGRDMRAVQKAEKFEILHDVADGGGRDLLAHRAGERAGADGIAGIEIGLDHAAKHLARAFVHFRQYLARVCHLLPVMSIRY